METIVDMGIGFQTSRNRLRVSYSVLLLAILITALIGYKGYSGLTKLQLMREGQTLELRDHLLRIRPEPAKLGFMTRSLDYLDIIWPALLFGVLISAWVHAFVSPAWLARTLGERAIRQQFTATIAGTPLMLCSCCASPLFSATYEKSKRLSHWVPSSSGATSG